MIIVDLILGLAAFIAVSVVSGFLAVRFNKDSLTGKVLQGLLFGTTAVIGMYHPFVLSEGIIFNGRPIVISICTLLFGPIAGAITAVMAIIFRLNIGGSGALSGSLVAITTFLIGYLFYLRRESSPDKKYSNFKLLQFGFIVNAVTLILLLLLPVQHLVDVFKTMTFTVLIIYPLFTLLMGRVLLDHEENQNYIKKISDSEKLFRTTLYSIGDGVITTNSSGIILNMNNIAEELTGWREVEAKNQPFNEIFRIINEDTKTVISNPIQKVIEKGAIVGLSNHTLLLSKDGKEIPIADSGSPIKDEENNIIGVVIVFRDQTEERAKEKSLMESEERLRLSLKAADQGLYDLNVQTGEAVVNDEYVTMLGYDPKTFVETNSYWLERLHPDDKPVTAKAYLDYVEGRTKEYKVEFRQKTKDNNWKWILSLGKIVEYDSDGKPLRMLGTHTDISAQKQTLAALQISEEKFAKMFRSSPDTITVTSIKDGFVTDINEAGLILTGFERKEFVGNKTTAMNLWVDPDRRNIYISQLMEKGRVNNFETQFRIKSGEVLDTLVSGELIELNQEKFVLSVIRDITEHKQIEKALFENQMRLQSIVSNAPVVLFGLDTDGIFTFSEGKGLSTLGLKPGEVVGRSGFEMYREYPKVVEALKRALKGEVLSIIQDIGEVVFDVYYAPLKNEGGQISGMIGVATDITERKEAEESLKESEERFHSMFEKHNAVMMLVEPESGKIADANFSAAQFYGYTVSELRQMNIGNINQLPLPQLKKELENAASRSISNFNFPHKLRSGEIRNVEVFTTPITVRNITLLFSIVHDVTERNIAEAKVLKSQAQLRALTARLEKIREDERVQLSRELHDNLGQSLTGLKMDVAWLERMINKKKTEQGAVLLDKTKSMSELIDQVINDVRRISSDLRPNVLDYLGLVPTLEWLVSDFKKRTETDCRFLSKVKDIKFDPATTSSVYRIIQEGFTNISRHSDAKKVELKITQTSKYFVFQLKDNGRGISKEEINNVNSLGIRGMKERTIQFGGELTIVGRKAKGTVVTLNISKGKQK